MENKVHIFTEEHLKYEFQINTLKKESKSVQLENCPTSKKIIKD